VLHLTGAGRSQTYKILGRLKGLLPGLVGAPGRPAGPPREESATREVLVAVRDFLLTHPGAACGSGERATYTDAFRCFVIELAAAGQVAEGMSPADFSFATGVPVGTLKDWLRLPRAPDSEDSKSCPNDSDPAAFPSIRNVHLRLIATSWLSWKGTFQAFCRMLRKEQAIGYGDTFIGSFLQAVGLRHRRPHTAVEAPWSSATFRALFPGAQWVGDGTSLALRWGQETFVFNLEAILDVASDALVGLTVSDTEDEDALRQAYQAAVETVGKAPLALTLDNRSSNHSSGAVAATAGTILLRSTPGRGQSKAPIEGAFGLFQQAMPPLVVVGDTPREQARTVLQLICTAWARGRNGRPRKKLRGATPAQAYSSARPAAPEIHDALAWIQQLGRRQECAQATREARCDPVRIELLSRGLAELAISDPDRHLATALAMYDRVAIARGLATFRAKQERGTLPPDADPGRYLGGIIRQLHIRLELECVSHHLFEQRLRLGDLTLAPLKRTAEQLRAELSPTAFPRACLDHALSPNVDVVAARFWSCAAADAFSALPTEQQKLLYAPLCRRIAASFRADRRCREDLLDRLAAAIITPDAPPI
jgi:transposase InsO family protein